MSDADPFADAAFSARLQKLISMLGSQQPGEAEAARRKLLDHLGHHRLSLTDVAMRLREMADAGGAGRGGFLQGAREASLERQLSIARAARQEAEAEAHMATQRAAQLEFSMQQAAFDVGRALQGQAQARLIGAIGWGVAALVAMLALVFQPHQRPAPLPPAAQTAPVERPTDPELAALGMHLAPGEVVGTVMVQDLPVRQNPADDANIRAFLNRGTRVIVSQRIRVGTQTWLQIRSVSGAGWVRGAAVTR